MGSDVLLCNLNVETKHRENNKVSRIILQYMLVSTNSMV